MEKHKIQLIIGSTREGRIGPKIAKWIKELNGKETILSIEIIDLKEIDLPFFDEPISPQMANYKFDHTKAWSAKIKEAEGYIFLTPEYNAGYPASLKNAIDFLYHEWKGKPTLTISYGFGGGMSAQKQLNEVFTRIGTNQASPSGSLQISQDMFGETGLKDPNSIFTSQKESMMESLVAFEKLLIN